MRQLEIELGIGDPPPRKPSVDNLLKEVYLNGTPGKVIYYDSRAFTTGIPIDPMTGEEIDIQPQLQFVSEDDPYPKMR